MRELNSYKIFNLPCQIRLHCVFYFQRVFELLFENRKRNFLVRYSVLYCDSQNAVFLFQKLRLRAAVNRVHNMRIFRQSPSLLNDVELSFPFNIYRKLSENIQRLQFTRQSKCKQSDACIMIFVFELTKGTPAYEQSQLRSSEKATKSPLRMAWV